MDKPNKGISTSIGLITILSLAVLAAGFILWQSSGIKNQDFSGGEITVTKDRESDKADEWQVYENKEYGFWLKYPPFVLEEEINYWKPEDLLGKKNIYGVNFPYICKSQKGEPLMLGTLGVIIGDNRLEDNLPGWIRQNEVCGFHIGSGLDVSRVTIATTSVDGLEALIIEGLGVCPPGVSRVEKKIYFAQGQYVYMIEVLSENILDEGREACLTEQKEIFEKMVQGFRLIKKEEKFINLIFPNGDEELVQGKTYKVKWESKGVEAVDIVLMNSAAKDFQKKIVMNYPACRRSRGRATPV